MTVELIVRQIAIHIERQRPAVCQDFEIIAPRRLFDDEATIAQGTPVATVVQPGE